MRNYKISLVLALTIIAILYAIESIIRMLGGDFEFGGFGGESILAYALIPAILLELLLYVNLFDKGEKDKNEKDNEEK